MPNFEKLSYRKDFETSNDFEEFNIEIENSLSNFNINHRKKILFSVTELIQNNIIHNNSSTASLEIKSYSNKIEIVFIQYLNENDYLGINAIITNVNNLSKEKLSRNIVDNIIFPAKETGTGNGFLICRQKTGNPIEFKIIEKLNIDSEALLKCSITLTINKYVQNN